VLESSFKKGAKKGIAAESAEYVGNKYVDDHITVDAVQTIKRLKNSNSPFFLAVGFMKPHSPYNAPKKYWDLYKRTDMKALGLENRPDNSLDLNWFDYKEIRGFTDLPNKGKFSNDTAQKLRHGYYAATSYVDDNVGQLIKALKDNGLYDNTIIVFWSDHGYHLGENGHWTKATVRELDTRVPLIFRIPGQKPFTSHTLTEYIDIYPTLAELTHLPAPVNLDGSSFKQLFTEPSYQHKFAALSQTARPWPGNKPIKQMGYTIRTESYRYTINTLFFNLLCLHVKLQQMIFTI
jgi:iduronate 2-sulfatase